MATNGALDEAILGILPDENNPEPWITTPAIALRLQELGHEDIYPKKVQRHLAKLEAVDRYVTSRENGRALEWQRSSWLWGAHGVGSLMTGSEAVAFTLLGRFTRNKLPEVISTDIEPFFKAAELRLSQQKPENRNHRRWVDKIAWVDGAFELTRPKPNPNVLQTISTAMFFERELTVTYRPAYKGLKEDAPARRLCPLALVESAGVMYMVAQDPTRPPRPEANKPDWLRTLFRLDRISKVEDTLQSFEYPKDFKLSEFISTQKMFDFVTEPPVTLELAFSGNAGEHLKESPMAKDQTVAVMRDGRLKVAGTVVPSLRLRWWIRSIGADVEVLAPKALRAEFAADYKSLAALYK
ncbi:WYL domain-containing protein [Caballeronia sp. dw_276]|uniref:helix-turn-helix transcriptional regulator n=1 Tax=Caballeronia sp. dw_276 TaxID=2719795 RepID=UPI001BD69090|nr:WYL domain-containing protein [Caballeronia sp. dw_276]